MNAKGAIRAIEKTRQSILNVVLGACGGHVMPVTPKLHYNKLEFLNSRFSKGNKNIQERKFINLWVVNKSTEICGGARYQFLKCMYFNMNLLSENFFLGAILEFLNYILSCLIPNRRNFIKSNFIFADVTCNFLSIKSSEFF